MHGLVLAGGGRRCAFQVGVLQHLLTPERMRFPIITGTSGGALNGAFLAQYHTTDGLSAIDNLASLWAQLSTRRIYRRWYFGALGRLPVLLPSWLGGKPSVYCTAPLQHMVRSALDVDAIGRSGIELRIGAVDLTTGLRRVWNQLDSEDLASAVLASSAFPLAFEPIEIDGRLYSDAGLVEQTPIEDAILAGATDLTVILTSPEDAYDPLDNPSGLDLAMRSIEASSAEIARWDLKVVQLYNALAPDGKRQIKVTVIRPELDLGDPLDFDPVLIRRDMEHGRILAPRYMARGR